jgi:hypothetical protein
MKFSHLSSQTELILPFYLTESVLKLCRTERNKAVTIGRSRANKAEYGVKKMPQEVNQSEREATEITAAVVSIVVSFYF